MRLATTSSRSRLFAGLCPLLLCLLATLPAFGQGGFETIHDFAASQASGWLGASVAAAGDVNGDGTPDFIVGSPFSNEGVAGGGKATVYSGADGAVIHTFYGGPGDRLGTAVAAMGDLDSDGYDDVVASLPFADALISNGGRVTVFSGLTGLELVSYDGTVGNDRVGDAVVGLGDVTGDGIPDFAVGVVRDDQFGSNFGSVRIVSGANGSLVLTIPGTLSNSDFGRILANVGDLNGDGINDLAASGPNGITPSGTAFGFAHVFSGATGIAIHSWNGAASGDQLGISLSKVGDVDGDGVPDLAVGAAGTDTNGSNTGSVFIMSGATGGTLMTIDGTDASASFGLRCAGLDDVDFDGTPDLVVSATNYQVMGVVVGALHVYSLASGTLLETIVGDAANDGVRSLANGGDLNGDGRTDFIAGMPFSSSVASLAGRVRVFNAPTPFPGSGEDFCLTSGINAAPDDSPLKEAVSGDILVTRLESPLGNYDFTVPVLVAQFFQTGSPITQPVGFPEVWINPSPFADFPVVLLYNGNDATLGPATLSPSGLNLAFTIPVGTSGLSVSIQGLALSPSANTGNPFFTATDGQIVKFL